MIIHAPDIQPSGSKTRVSSRLEFRTRNTGLPEILWIDFPDTLKHPHPSERSDGFAAGLLILAMSLGEDLEVRGTVCPRLAYGLEQYQEAVLCMYPNLFHKIELRFERLAPSEAPSDDGIVCQAFSGGVDSFYTLHNHAPEKESGHRMAVTHALLMHGFDLPLADERSFAQMANAYAPLLQGLGVQLIPASTNIREVTGNLNWEITHGSALAFAALSLGASVRAFLVSSTGSYMESIPWGSDIRLDHWLSTAQTELIYYGSHRTRAEKLLAIADWEPFRQGLHVCWENPDGIRNCCRCGKCLRTMMLLQVAGALEHFPTFPLPYDARIARKLPHDDDILVISAENIFQVAQKRGNREILRDVNYILRRIRRKAVQKWIRNLLR